MLLPTHQWSNSIRFCKYYLFSALLLSDTIFTNMEKAMRQSAGKYVPMQALGAQSQTPMNQSQTNIRSEKKNRMLPISTVTVSALRSFMKLDMAFPTISEIMSAYTRHTVCITAAGKTRSKLCLERRSNNDRRIRVSCVVQIMIR